MRTSLIESDDEDECLPTSTDLNEDLFDLKKNNKSSVQKNTKENRTKDTIENKSKSEDFLKKKSNTKFLIKPNEFLKSKRLRLHKQNNSENFQYFKENDIDSDKDTQLNSLINDDSQKKNDKEHQTKFNIPNDVVIKKYPNKSLKLPNKRFIDESSKDLPENILEQNPKKIIRLSENQEKFNLQKFRIQLSLSGSSVLRKQIQSYQNCFKNISESAEKDSTSNVFENRGNISSLTETNTSFGSNQEIFYRIASKRELTQKNANDKIANSLTENTINSNKSTIEKFIELQELLKPKNKIETEKENSQRIKVLSLQHKGQLFKSKPSLSLTKIKRSLTLQEQNLPPKRFKDSKNSENSLNNNIFNDMSVYDRRSAVFGMDNIADRTNISNGLLSRISNDENSGNNQYYSNSSGLNGQIHQQQQSTTIATLCNIGNTCYLNSVVYTLRFAPLFLHNLHHLVDELSSVNQNIVKYRTKSSSLGRNVSGLHIESARSWSSKDLASLESNSITGSGIIGGIGLGGGGIGNFSGSNTAAICDNQKTSQQIVTEKLHELYQHLHRNEMNDSTEPFHADTFLHAIQDVSAIFEGNQQQDAHEFLMCVLDNIRETCQSLTKAITECPDVISNGYVGIPEQVNESKTANAATTTNAITNIVPLSKEQITSQNNASNSSNIIKTSFFSRKSKRKDEAKNSKNNRLLSKTAKENPVSTNLPSSVDSTDASNVNSAIPSNILGTSLLENDISNADKNISTSSVGTNSQKDNNKERLEDKIKKLGLDFFSQYFEGITVSTTKCLSCETITEQKETMIDIAVPISGYENADSGNFIQNSCITREYFRGENKYRCEQCTGYTEAIRSISYEVLPRLLIIQLSRFSGGMEKINSYLPTPFTLQCFCSQCCKASDNEKLHIYKLYSVITHVGATMSVGHYIAYTCSLDWSNEYVNCPKDKRRQQQIQQQQQQNKIQNLSSSNKTSFGGSNNNPNSNLSNGNANITEKNMGLVKKLIYGRSKASSSGDMTKNMKNLNGISSSTKDITNGVEKLKVGPTLCQGLNCCGIKLRQNNLNYSSNSLNNITSGIAGSINSSSIVSSTNLNGSYVDLIDDNNINSGHTPGFSSMNGSRNYHQRQQQSNEPIWYMCDDDKIKAMSQREFEELLSPNRKIMITPYLLFYARKSLNNSDSTNDINSESRIGSDE